MDVIVPRSSGTYINDALFTALGFFTGVSTVLQRNFAYGIGETQIEREIQTFLSPTTFTGSFPDPLSGLLQSPVGKLISIPQVVFYERYANNVDRLISGTAYITDPDNGFFYLEISQQDNSSCGGCSGDNHGIYRADVTITSGYSTGRIVNDPNVLLALAMASNQALKTMEDIGIATEENEILMTTIQAGRTILSTVTKHFTYGPLGVSTRANFIRNLVKYLKRGSVGKLGG